MERDPLPDYELLSISRRLRNEAWNEMMTEVYALKAERRIDEMRQREERRDRERELTERN